MSLKQDAYNIIKAKIIKCEYLPNALLNEDMLKEELQMSRTPVRDALSRLEQEHLVKIIPKKGFTVTGISLNDAEKVYEVRMLLEPHALEIYGHKIAAHVYEGLAEQFTRAISSVPVDTIFEEDDDFHSLIIEATDNSYIIQAYRYPYVQNIRLRAISGHYGEKRLERSQAEHMAIINACLKQEWKKAASALNTHLESSLQTFREIIAYQNMRF